MDAVLIVESVFGGVIGGFLVGLLVIAFALR